MLDNFVFFVVVVIIISVIVLMKKKTKHCPLILFVFSLSLLLCRTIHNMYLVICVCVFFHKKEKMYRHCHLSLCENKKKTFIFGE